ncbi:tRNA-5-carboxymethylaminomethyl-2-thiouridine(34)synthesis protein MnmE [hydrothermal vent metagenome]|uniref:tRNA-5-carboxymethylaminomethyl-2-thiouridine(34) synthesis protein MnmE n=1 Tax=hydrothermal vent metagenome TaxID=652676 RepID=A0A3B0SI52_9ZZZZ
MVIADTIFALSSGAPPAAIGIIRVSGPQARKILEILTGNVPKPRVATLRNITDPVTNEQLDSALCLWFPGPHSATGEDLAEIHCHGGRAVIRAIENTLEQMDGLRRAEPGEFTRRTFSNGRIDLAEAEGLSDLLFAETEAQRKSALRLAGGALSRQVEQWQKEILRLSALVEAELDFSDEDDVSPTQGDSLRKGAESLSATMLEMIERPRAEKLRDGVRVVLGGPPNSGKSTLLNALVEREAAIVSDVAGTTRDVIEVPVAIGGIPFLLIDTAGVREESAEEIERIGIERARKQFALADIILWLGPEGERPERDATIELAARSDHLDFQPKSPKALIVSPVDGTGMSQLVELLISKGKAVLPDPDETSINKRQADHLMSAQLSLANIIGEDDYLVIGEQLRIARRSLDTLTGRASTEDMLDALFGRFCIGK